MDRHFNRQNIGKTLTFFALTILTACGPRSGVHNDETKEQLIDWEGQSPPEKVIDVSYSDKGQNLFKVNCAVCHSAHTDQYIAGPGFKGIFDRLPKPSDTYFINYTLNCDSVFNSGDPYALKLRAENKEQRMTVFKDILTNEDAREIIKFLAGQRTNF